MSFAVSFRFFTVQSNFQLKLDRKIVHCGIIHVLTTSPVHVGSVLNICIAFGVL